MRNFSPSTNIIRDINTELNYIPTPNSKIVFEQLLKNYSQGTRSFNIIGAYGSGKSSFLWAFEKNINHKKEYFGKVNGQLKGLRQFEFVQIVGEYDSLIDGLSKALNISSRKAVTSKEIFNELELVANNLKKKQKGLVIVIDEFGKFLEYAAKNNPESELYFIQQLAEFVNDINKNIFLITTLHQDFNSYSYELTKSQKAEWDKVKGRLTSVTFNEPVEQLLYLASERIKEIKLSQETDKNFSKLFRAIEIAKVFPLRDYFTEEFAKKLLPFDILSASILTIALQQYGQNERSLFSFLESNDHLGIREFDTNNNQYYDLSCVHDYLQHNFYSFLSTKNNPHYSQWAGIRRSIERAEVIFEDSPEDAVKLIKSLGLCNIFTTGSARLDYKFLVEYSKYSLGIKNPEAIIEKLEKNKVIRYVGHAFRYKLFEGTDLNIELAIDEAGKLVERVTNVVGYLNNYFDFPFIAAKSIYYRKGTPRYFSFRLSEEPIKEIPENEIDGFINLIFSDTFKEKTLKEVSEENKEAILFGLYKNTTEISSLIYEIEKVKKVKENNDSDQVAVRELDLILQHQKKLLNHYVLGSLYSEDSKILWYFKGEKIKINDRKTLNQILSQIIEKVYSKTPTFKSELVNKTKLSGQVSAARRSFITNLIQNWDKEDIGLPKDKFPPEKSIYLSLLKETGIHQKSKNSYIITEPSERSFAQLWKLGVDFLESSKQNRRSLSEFIEKLLIRPYKLKQGLIDFWVPVFLFSHKDDYALFYQNTYVPFINEDILELVVKNPRDYEIKAFDIEGVKLNIFNHYRKILEQSEEKNPSSQSFIETIKPFLTFYRGLPDYSKNTKRMSKSALALREAIATAKDPERTFFEEFPRALDFNLSKAKSNSKELEQYVLQIQECIREIRTCYDELLNRIEAFILDEILGQKLKFPEYKNELKDRFKKLKIHLLLPYQKTFYQRLISPLDEKKTWLSSVASGVLNKSLESISDEEEKILFDKLYQIIHELDNLSQISKADINEEKEEVLKLEITSFVEGIQENLVRLPKTKTKDISGLEKTIKSKLSKDKQVNIVILTKLLQEQLKK